MKGFSSSYDLFVKKGYHHKECWTLCFCMYIPIILCVRNLKFRRIAVFIVLMPWLYLDCALLYTYD
jgi:hypothetical protein